MADGQAYDVTHRAFLQAIMARSTITFAEAQPVLAAILSVHDQREIHPQDISTADFAGYISVLNSVLEPLDYEIRSTVHQSPPRRPRSNNHDDDDNDDDAAAAAAAAAERIWGFVNTTSDPLTQLATTLGPDDIAFVKRVLDAMFVANNTRAAEVMAVTGMEALKLCKAPRNSSSSSSSNHRESMVAAGGGTQQMQPTQMTQGSAGAGLTVARAEEVLGALVEEGWFEKSRAGYYCLSPRALMELRGWLVETYNEEADEGQEEEEEERWDRIKFCEACRELVTIGQRCANHECNCRLHNMCVQSFFRNQSARRCPNCKGEWSGQAYVGEKAANRSRRRGTAGAGRTVTANLDGADDDEDEE